MTSPYTWADVLPGQKASSAAVNALGNTVEAHDAELALFFPPLRVVKAADETITGTTTLQDDNHIFLSLPANMAYNLELHLFYTSPAAGDLKLSWTAPSGLTMLWGGFGLATGGSLTQFGNQSFADWPFNLGSTGGSVDHAAIWGSGATTNAGTLQMQWAQVAASGSPTVHAGTFLVITRYA